MSLFEELRRRNVFRVGIAYVLLGWVVLQGADLMLDLIGAPDWVIRVFAVGGVVGLPFALFFAWAFELTPEGIKRERDVDRSKSITPQTGRKLDRAIIVFLVLAVAFLLFDRFFRMPESTAVRPAVSQPAEAAAEHGARDRRSVAVLPFDFRSNNPDDEFFAEGIHDDLLTHLAKIGSLKVISRTSVMEYKDTTKKIPQIADELGVATIVEGAVQRSGSRVRLNAQLIDAATDEHLWAESFDRELTAENLFDIQAEIARAIAGALQATLSPEEEAQLDRVLTSNLQAWESYQRALRLRLSQEVSALIAGLAEIDHTLTLDPEFAAAWSLKAILLLQKFWFYDTSPALRDEAWAAIEKGRAIDPTLPELDLAEGFYHYWGFLDYESALAALDRAVAVLPNSARIHQARSYVLRRMGQWEDCLAAFRRATELSPRDGINFSDMGSTFSRLKRFDEADQAFAQATRLSPDASSTVTSLGEHQLQSRGEPNEALRYLRLAPSTFPDSYHSFWNISLMARDFEPALQIVADWPEHMLDTRVYSYSPAFLKGITLVHSGRAEEAGPLLEAAEQDYASRAQAGPGQFTALMTLCQIKGALGKVGDAQDSCRQAREHIPVDAFLRGENLYHLAKGLAMAGATEDAVDFLDKSLAASAGFTVYWVEPHPAFGRLRGDPAYRAVIERYRGFVKR